MDLTINTEVLAIYSSYKSYECLTFYQAEISEKILYEKHMCSTFTKFHIIYKQWIRHSIQKC